MISGLRQSSKLSNKHVTNGEFQKAIGNTNHHKRTEALAISLRFYRGAVLPDTLTMSTFVPSGSYKVVPANSWMTLLVA
jgi:hypothetical protein